MLNRIAIGVLPPLDLPDKPVIESASGRELFCFERHR